MPNNESQDWVQVDTAEIFNAAVATGADRVVFLSDGNFSFATVDRDSIETQIKKNNPQKYKLQKFSVSRWDNLTSYLPVSSAASSLTELSKGTFKSTNPASITALSRAAATDSSAFHYSLKSLLKRANFEKPSEKWRDDLQATISTLERLAETHSDPYLKYVIASLDLQDSVTSLRASKSPTEIEIEQAEANVVSRTREAENRHDSPEASIAKHMALGKILSLKDRPSAEHHFGKIRDLDTIGIVDYFYIDMGSMTYFHEGQICDIDYQRAKEIQNSIVTPEGSTSTNRQGIFMSVDPHFFRIYATIILFYAQQMPDVDYNILVCGDDEEFNETIESGKQYSQALNQLNMSGIPNNVFYHKIPVPHFATDRKTFFASARFFGAEKILEKYESLYIMDADLTTDVDPRPYFDRIKSISFSVPRTSGSDLISPWRRYGAGNVAISREALGTPILKDLQGYLAHGLSKQSNWMLDQNALCYAIEKNQEHYTDLSKFNRPFGQPKFRSLWEKNYWQSIRKR